MDAAVAIIGGSGLYSLGDHFELIDLAPAETPYGETSAGIEMGEWHNIRLAFLPRHGREHRIPPHKINFRANIWALKQMGVDRIISVNAVGGITPDMPPLTLALPDQIIDYSSGREDTFSDGDDKQVNHIDFSWPYSAELRGVIAQAALDQGQSLVLSATYACTNGPRLETAAEIARIKNDGCNIVGMTGMPEAALARELAIDYAALALVVNWAAGIKDNAISMNEILEHMEQGMQSAKSLLLAAARLIDR
jgi:5'-methylthioinosine phosphorylase